MSIGAALTLIIAAGAILWGVGVVLRERRLARRLRLTRDEPSSFLEPDAFRGPDAQA